MATKRIRFRITSGSFTPIKRNLIRDTLFNKGVKFSKIVEARDAYIVVCFDEEDVDKTLASEITNKLSDNGLDVVIPPPLRAKKSVVVRRLDKEITQNNAEDIAKEVEKWNPWSKVDEVYKFRNLDHMIKIRFQEIGMARKAENQGICMFSYFINPNQIEPEIFYPITPCWACYHYDHLVKDCPNKDIKKCSECAAQGHTFRECVNRNNPKCLNCDGDHRTLSAQCPIRREMIKQKREESVGRRQQVLRNQSQDRTYAAVSKLSKEIPKLVTAQNSNRSDSVIQLNSNTSFKILALTVQAHLMNIAKPGTFGRTMRELLRLNNLPDVVYPDDAPSAEIFGVINSSQGGDINTVTIPSNIYDESSDEEVDIMSEDEPGSEAGSSQGARGLPPPPPISKPQRKPKITSFAKPSQKPQTKPKVIPPTPAPSPTSTPETKRKHSSIQGLEVVFVCSEDRPTPTIISPPDLISYIDIGRVKYRYRGAQATDQEIIEMIRSGRISTTNNPVQPVENVTFRKVRNGLIDRDTGGRSKTVVKE